MLLTRGGELIRDGVGASTKYLWDLNKFTFRPSLVLRHLKDIIRQTDSVQESSYLTHLPARVAVSKVHILHSGNNCCLKNSKDVNGQLG